MTITGMILVGWRDDLYDLAWLLLSSRTDELGR